MHKKLTPRQTQILKLIADGLEAPVIAKRLCLSRLTVYTHVTWILSNLGAKTRANAVHLGHLNNLL